MRIIKSKKNKNYFDPDRPDNPIAVTLPDGSSIAPVYDRRYKNRWGKLSRIILATLLSAALYCWYFDIIKIF